MKDAGTRLRIMSLGIILFALVLIGKLYLVQIVNGSVFQEKAEHQYTSSANFFDRGTIYFSPKEGSLLPAATLKSGLILAINPQIISKEPNIDNIYERINEIVPINKDDFTKKVYKTEDPYEELARKLPNDIESKINNLDIPGVNTYKHKWRLYSSDEMAAHTLGFIGYSGDELSGRYGLERYYEKVLGRSSDDAFVNFFAEIFSNIKKTVSDEESLAGDIVTTIEPTIESFLEEEIKKVNTTYGSEFTGGIVIDPKTGAIYAIAMDPTFNPNRLNDTKDVAVFSNKFVEDRYEMGSIIKPLTLAAGIDSGAITRKSTFNDPGCMTLNKKTFCNYDLKSHGSGLPMQVILNKSLNTGVATVVSRMGNGVFRDYLLKFGLGEITGIDLPNEGSSLISNLDTKRDLEMTQASFGQGIALTPLITVRALSALANGGTLIQPHLVKEIRYKIGTTKTIEYPVGERVLKPETSEEISRMLTEVVDTSLRGGEVRLPNYSIAAKTGTAQIAKPGGYYEDRYLHSFFGYFPSYDPKFLIFLYTYYPKDVKYASETLTDTFINMAKFLINYYDIPPDREAPPPPTA